MKNSKALTDVNDIYYGLLLQNRAKEYGIKPSDAFTTYLASKAKDDWLTNFNADDWSYNNQTKGKGLSAEGLKIVEMLAYSLSDKDLKSGISSKLSVALNKLIG